MSVGGPGQAFGAGVRFDGDEVVLDVQGHVDGASAPVLSAMLDALVASGYQSIALDLFDMDSVNAAGLAVIAGAAHTLAATAGQLSIRSSSTVARVLDVAMLSGLVSWGLPTSGRLGSEEAPPAAGLPVDARSPEVANDLRAVAAMPANADVVDAALRLVVALVCATVAGTDGASVTLRRHGRLATVAASDQTILDMDAVQYATGEGPCLDATAAGRWFHAESLDEETRWPTFTPRARALGISAILSSPLLAQDRPVGAINIYSRTATAFAASEQKLAGVFANEASNILTEAGAHVTDDQLTGRLQGALRTREIIAEAQGVIMEREDIGDKEAFDVMRRSSQSSNKPLSQGAMDVVESTHRNQSDAGPSRGNR